MFKHRTVEEIDFISSCLFVSTYLLGSKKMRVGGVIQDVITTMFDGRCVRVRGILEGKIKQTITYGANPGLFGAGVRDKHEMIWVGM